MLLVNYKKKRILVVFLLSFALILWLVCFEALAVEKISLGTGSTTGTNYITGAIWAELVNKGLPDVNITAEVTTGSGENLNLMDQGEIELCQSNSLIAYQAWNGLEPFDHKLSSLRSLTYIHGSIGHFVVLKSSNINTWADLKGKRFCVGAPMSSQDEYNRAIAKAVGISDEELKAWEKKWVYQDYKDGITALKDGRLDAVTIYTGLPASAVIDISATHNINLVGLTKEQQKKAAEVPFLEEAIIPGGMYKGVDEDVLTVVNPHVLLADKDLSPDLVYNIIKIIHENLDSLSKSHISFELWKFEPNVGDFIPLHEGAKRYYREIGLLK